MKTDAETLYQRMRDVERQLAECITDQEHSRLSDLLCQARRDWRQSSGRQAGWDAVPHSPAPLRNPRIL